MKNKTILSLALLGAISGTQLFADKAVLTPYGGRINNSSSVSQSIKDYSSIGGAHVAFSNLEYSFEADYAHVTTTYKDNDIPQLSQDDIAISYSKYNSHYMLGGGLHYTDTTDKELGNGIVGFVKAEGYQIGKHDRFSYGVEAYFSYYGQGHNEAYLERSAKIFQLTPYIRYYTDSGDISNTAELKSYAQYSFNYSKKNYFTVEVSDTVYYKDFHITGSYYNGEMRTGVKNGGFVVYNTMDLYKEGYGISTGYQYKPYDISFQMSYTRNSFREYDQTQSTITQDNKADVWIFSVSKNFSI